MFIDFQKHALSTRMFLWFNMEARELQVLQTDLAYSYILRMVNGWSDLQLIIYYNFVIHTKEGNVLFNTFYLRLYGVGHMVKYHSDGERGNPWATLSDQQQGLLYVHHPTDRIVHTTAFVTPVVEN